MKSIAALGIQLLSVVAVAGIGPTVAAAPASADSTLYASIAISYRTGATAASWNYRYEWAAEDAAEDACGSDDCVAYVNTASGLCAAVARAADNTWMWARAYSRAEAAANAIGASTGPRPQVIQTVCQDSAWGIGAIQTAAPQQPLE
ncbi:DUF4189 domain-containing protein [Nocardia sp. NPDC058519]|uniref:DUF4189 domain-containing protein n=1 Tax=unclassified Nocardia TaxID=2637762 RepID=UPI0036596F15